ncbi:putative ankyrin repeat-containing domain, PGG domain-containing protein [Medicago truncatula]|uniref:Putative ankyrin repeat-containing domain, PGG domain-containing protein n=1 Tax=Medicago truncatula TaxID=3880 RepID=A0A396GMV0_MEDTR|nr:ankyrin repeat-containing protein BDA1 [Medicago truncatula]RHN41843.1 putative ankyrin repeat-containing domain, PGG domain-containing protein [Medicago truncatula]
MNTMNDIDYKLKVAAQEGDINLLYTLIEEDPYVLEYIDLIPFVETPLHIAASMGHVQFATEIMRLKPSFAWKLNQQGFSPIHLALQNNQKSMVLRFVDMNKELVRIKGKEGLTPLHLACQSGEIDLLANFLFVCPNSIEDVTVRGETALHIAVKNEHYESLHVLVGWLKTTRQRGAREFEKLVLNYKDEKGNTVLHISALNNDLKALRLLVKTKINLNAKNSENSTALDIAASSEIKGILLSAGAKPSSKVKDVSKLEDKLRSNVTILDKMLIYILRIRKDISEEQRNAFLIVATLIATATYQSALSPPGGVYQGNAGDYNNNVKNNTSLNSKEVGKSVISEGDFFTLSILNTLSLLLSTMTIYLLTPSGLIGGLLFTPIFWFAYCYVYNMRLISPTSTTSTFNLVMVHVFNFLHSSVYWSIFIVYKRLKVNGKDREIKIRNRLGGNKW